MSDVRTRFDLQPDQIPTAWFNLVPDMVKAGMQPLPPLSPQTKEPMGPADLAPLFPESLIMQEVSTEPWIDIPGEVIDIYRLWRPSPLFRATRLEQALDTPARIYFKYEGVSPAGSHKPNTAVPQAFYNKQAGIRRIATETGAGQWGSSMAMACSMFGLECDVYMVKASYEQKPYRRVFMETFGASVVASPSDKTNSGRAILEAHPDSTGSLGIAISEAVEDAATHEDTNYALGSVLGHVLLHQTVIGLEAQQQMEMAGERPDVIVGCVGGGSNYAGLAYPFMADKLRGETSTRFLADRAGGLSHADEGTVRLRLRRHRRRSVRSCRCTRWATTSCRRRCTRADFATTATRRACRCWSTKVTWRRWPTRRTRSSRPRCCSRRPRGSSRRRSRATRSRARSTRRSPRRTPARSA